MKFVENGPVVLASASPRRKELLERLGISFTVDPAVKEEPPVSAFDTPAAYVAACAYAKAKEVAEHHPGAIVIGSDTAVVKDGEVLLKPKSKVEAIGTLRKLSGDRHQVMTAVTVLHDREERSFTETAQVTFFGLEDAWIEAYTDTQDPYDKAGAYGIQTASMLFVKEIEGDYNTVVGLPLAALAQHLAADGHIRLEGADRHADRKYR